MRLLVLLLALGCLVAFNEARPHHRHRHHRRHHLHRRHHNACERCHLEGRGKVCKVEEACKRIRAVQKALEAQTAAMAAQGKNLAGRLDAAEGKMVDIETIGKKLTDLLGVQQDKITEQGAALASQEAKLSDQITKQAETLKAKIAAQDAKFSAIEENGQKLDAALSESDGKIAGLQNEGVKVLDTVAAQEKKITSALQQQVSKLATEMPVPDGKFTEISDMHAKLAEKMDEADAGIAAAAGAMNDLKTKVSSSGVKLGDMAGSQAKIDEKITAQDVEIEAEATTATNIADSMKASEEKMAAVAGQGAALAEQIGTAASKVGGLAVANLKRKEKMTKQAEALADVGANAKLAEGKLKDQASKLGKAEDVVKAPPEPAPAPGNTQAGMAGEGGGAAAEKMEEEMEKMDDNLKAIQEIDVNDDEGTCPAFTPGDGKGSGEEKISETLTGRACIAECESRQEKDSTINGATVWADAGKKGCWCEKGMNGVNTGSTKYKTCKFEVKDKGTCPSFTPGDGKGSGEEKISETLTGRACIAECWLRKEKDSTINGATVWADAGKKGCWCEKGMNGVNTGSTKYKTCKFEE